MVCRETKAQGAISVLAGGGLCPWGAGTKRIIAVATAFFLLERRGLEEGPLSLYPLLSKRPRGWREEEGEADRSSAAEENVPCQGNRGRTQERQDTALWSVTAVN